MKHWDWDRIFSIFTGLSASIFAVLGSIGLISDDWNRATAFFAAAIMMTLWENQIDDMIRRRDPTRRDL